MPDFLDDEHCESSEIPALEPVLRKWIFAQREYMKLDPNDNPWDYGECSCTGFLAAGVWLCGGVALEEWAAEKCSEVERRWNGRGDLWISTGGKSVYVEAKYEKLVVAGTDDDVRAAVEYHLSRAVNDARMHTAHPAEQLGVVFLVPVFRQGEQEGLHDRIARWLQAVYLVPHSAVGWLFRPRAELLAKDYHESPGIVLIARTLERDSRIMPQVA